MRLVDGDLLIEKWRTTPLRDRIEFDKVIMTTPTFEVKNNLEVYTVSNTIGDPNAINVFTFHVDNNGDMALGIHEYYKFYEEATKKLPDFVSTCLIPDTMTAEVWTKDSLQSYINNLQELLHNM